MSSAFGRGAQCATSGAVGTWRNIPYHVVTTCETAATLSRPLRGGGKRRHEMAPGQAGMQAADPVGDSRRRRPFGRGRSYRSGGHEGRVVERSIASDELRRAGQHRRDLGRMSIRSAGGRSRNPWPGRPPGG